jgi:hypothetical protein
MKKQGPPPWGMKKVGMRAAWADLSVWAKESVRGVVAGCTVVSELS